TAIRQVGQPLTLTAIVTGADGTPFPGVPVMFRILAGPNAGETGVLNPADGLTGVNDQVTFTYVGGGAGTDTIVATAMVPGGAIVTSSQVMASWISGPPPPPIVLPPPTVLALQRFGFHAQPTTLVISFSTALDPASAQALRNYRLVGLRGHGRTGRPIRLL